MAVQVHRAPRWRELVRGLAEALSTDPPGPFETVEVVVSSRGAGRMLSQALATELPAGICAGISFPTLAEWIRGLATRHALAEELDAWRSVRASVVTAGALETLSASHAILGAHLTAGGSPARRQQLAQRSVQLFRRYVDHAPQMVGRWLDGEDVDALGHPLPEHLTWQPAVLRLTAERLETNPLEVWGSLADAARDLQDVPVHVFAVSEVSATQATVLEALAGAANLTVWQVTHVTGPDWAAGLVDGCPDLPPRPEAPVVALHGSHGHSRQVEVLRDELCRRFADDPELEPRDVVVVCQNPQDWWPHLRTAFAPVDGDPTAHPGRRLRVQAGNAHQPNLVLEVISRSLRLPESRATATDLTELLLLGPIAHRWRLGQRREALLALVSESGIRWGLDQHHRAQLDVPGITQNTWLRGIDRLLVGLAVEPGADAGLGLMGVAGVGTSELDLVGTLAELLSRLRRFNSVASAPATAGEWVERVRGLLTDIVGCSFDDEWMLLQATSALTDLAEHLSEADGELNRSEFTRLFEYATREFTPRPTVGNGSLQVIGVGDLQHVDFKLVCLLGIGDRTGASDVDSVDLGPDVAEPRRLRLNRLLTHARAADEVLVIQQSRDPLTDQEVASPTTISWFLRELGRGDTPLHQHPLLAHSEENFTGSASFDQQGLAAALALRAADATSVAPHTSRRRAAVALPVEDLRHEVSLKDLGTFLADPARDFLRSAAEVRLWEAPRLTDEMPFVLGGLDQWQARDRFLTAFKRGLTPQEAATAEFQRELVPPGHIGRATLRQPLEDVENLWRQAWPQWSAQVVDHRVELELGNLVLADTVRVRGGEVIHVTVSDGIRTQVEPWLRQLALAASGIPVPAAIHMLHSKYGSRSAVAVTLAPPEQDVAVRTLSSIADAFAQGRSRLVPLPQDLALAFADQLAHNSLDQAAWQVPASDWRGNTLWQRFSESWRLFYSGVPVELFEDPAGPRDPEPPTGFDSAFAAWAAAIYLPLVHGGQ